MPRPANPALAALCIVVLAACAPAQQTTIRSQSNVVVVPALVRDNQGALINGLKADDFVIEDNGVEQAVQLDETEDPGHVSLVVAIETGRKASSEFERIRTLNTMLQPAMGEGHTQVALVTFDSQARVLQEFTNDPAVIGGHLKKLRPGDGGAAILDALQLSLEMLDKLPRSRQRVLLLISETREHGSGTVKVDDVVASIGISNTAVYALAFSPSLSNVLDDVRGKLERESDHVDIGVAAMRLGELVHQAMRKNIPKTVAAMTGGEYEVFKSHNGFESRMSEFTNHLYGRYMLSFVPKDAGPGLHQLRVRLKGPANATVIARMNYWAVGKPESDSQP